MTKHPFFSVIIPLYNKEDYIQNTLESVLKQSFKDFEIIIVNDGSTDESLEKAKTILLPFNNFKIVTQENKGLSETRNKGISLSKGEVIALIDADDLWEEHFLQSIYNLYTNFPDASLYGTDYFEKYSDKNILEPKKNIDPNLKNKEFIVDDFFLANKFQSIIAPSSLAFKKEITKDVLFDETITYAEDVDFYLKSFTKCRLAYLYAPMVTVLFDVPNQMTKIGIKNKTLPDLDVYEKNYPNEVSLKKYLDFKRYMYAIQYKLDRDKKKFLALSKNIDISNLSLKQRILLRSPLFLVNIIRGFKRFLLKHNIRITSY